MKTKLIFATLYFVANPVMMNKIGKNKRKNTLMIHFYIFSIKP